MIRFDHFSFTYAGQHSPALRNVTLEIGMGEVVLVTGPSGGGKSTLCRCLNGLVPHFHGGRLMGCVEVDRLNITEHQPREFATIVGMVFQDPENQVVSSDVERDIAFGLENLGLEPDIISQRVDESLSLLGLCSLRRKPVSRLSGGEKQKVALAAALAMRPRVMVLDEPTSELDPESAREFMKHLMYLQGWYGLTVVLTEHRLERVADFCNRIVVLDGGEVVADGNPSDVLEALSNQPHGVGLPPMVEMGRMFGSAGLWQGKAPRNLDEARAEFGHLLPSGIPVHPLDRKPSAGDPLIVVEDLWFGYGKEQPVLRGISTQVRAGELVALMGRNGSGKTTLAKHLNGLLKPVKGRVLVRETDTRNAAVPSLARTVGLVFQNPNDHLFAETVEGELLFTLKHMGVDEDEVERMIDETLALFGLRQYRMHYSRDLSGGERQRVALASVVVARPAVLVLDEPTRGLEHGRKEELLRFLTGYCGCGGAVILITHDVEMVARHADRVLLLDQGKVVADGPKRFVLSGSEVFRPDVNVFVRSRFSAAEAQAFMTVDDVVEAMT